MVASGKLEEATLVYRKAAQKTPGSAEAHYRLAVALSGLQRYGEAIEELRRANELAPDRDDIRAPLGELCLSGFITDPRRPKAAYECLQRVADQYLARDPNAFPGLRFKAYVALFDRRLADAIPLFRQARALKPNQPDVTLSLIEALLQDNQEAEAEKIAQEFIHDNPSHGPAYDALYAHYLAAKQTAKAEAIWRQKIANNPDNPVYVTDLAKLLWRLGRQRDAMDLIAKMQSSPGRRAESYLAVGDFFGSIQRGEDALREFQQGENLSPGLKEAFQKRIADVYLLEGRNQDASQVIAAILERHPKDAEALRIRIGLRLNKNDPASVSAALADYKALSQSSPDDPTIHYNYGQALLIGHNLAGARSQMEEAVRIRPDFAQPLMDLARIAWLQHKPTDTIGFCDQVIQLAPQDPSARLLKALALTTSGRESAARVELNEILRFSPRNGDALLQLVLLDIAAKDFKKAETQLAHLHDVDPTRAAGGSAVLLAAKGQLDKAAEVLARARMQPESGSLMHSMLGALADQSHRFDVAMAEYKLALVDRPDDIALLMSLGNAASQQGQWDAAIAAFEQAQKASPNEFTPTVMLAFTLQRAGRSDRAMEEYRRALGLQPDNPRVLNNLAFLIVETHGNLDEAKKLAEDAVRKDPKDPQFKDTLGWIYFQKDDAKFALPIFKALVEQHPTDTTFLYHLGAAQLRTGTKDAGRQTLQAALSNGASGPEAEKIRALLSSN